MMNAVTPNHFELLSNELLLEIFEYLDAYNLYEAFHGLNQRINGLLQKVNLHIDLQSSSDDQTVVDKHLSFFNPSQVRILSSNINTTDIIKQCLSFANQTLHSLRLCHLTADVLHPLLSCLPQNSRIKYLRIDESYSYNKIGVQSITDMLFTDYADHFTSLTVLLLSFSTYREFSHSKIVLPQLRHLTINHFYWESGFIEFLSHSTPNLRSLCVNPSINIYQPPNILLKQIRELDVYHRSSWIGIEIYFVNFPSLNRLKIRCDGTYQSSVTDGQQWQKLIEKFTPHLKQLTINYEPGVDQEIIKSFYIGDFWSTKKVNVIKTMNKLNSRCPLVKSIYFGPRWHSSY